VTAVAGDLLWMNSGTAVSLHEGPTNCPPAGIHGQRVTTQYCTLCKAVLKPCVSVTHPVVPVQQWVIHTSAADACKAHSRGSIQHYLRAAVHIQTEHVQYVKRSK
jgi:hypothetical protein